MYIKEISIRNFRILSNATMNPGKNLCLLIGRNNTGKTSFMVLFEKFLKQQSFDFNDFSISVRDQLLGFNKDTDEVQLAIQLILTIQYEDTDDLCNLSEFIMDLEPSKKDVHLLFECLIKKDKLLEGIQNAGTVSKEKFIQKNISQYLERRFYAFDNNDDLKPENRARLIKKEFKDVDKLIDFEIIHAKRSVSSSEEKNGRKVLSDLTTAFFNGSNLTAPDKFEQINALIESMDVSLDNEYDAFFSDFLKTAKDFLGMAKLRVRSNLKAAEIMSDASEVVYGDDTTQLPEYLNGLGHMNILYLLLNIEIKKESFRSNKKDIKILFIEEPEAHTHPQLQYIFARKISEIVSDIPGMQTIISTHSPHIVANHPFENIRYMSTETDKNGFQNIKIKNFHEELSQKYANEPEEFQFVKLYLSIDSAELFFADKAIFIEGISEQMLINQFITQFDNEKQQAEKKAMEQDPKLKASYIPLSAQNITILQVGANSKAFRHFLDFLEIPSVIITDIDTTKAVQSNKKTVYPACAVSDPESCRTSNASIAYYLGAPEYKKDDADYKEWFKKMVSHDVDSVSSFVHIAYQKKENDYHARSFEDAFINVNYGQIEAYKGSLNGLKKIKEITKKRPDDIYQLTQNVLEEKSDLASSLLFLAYTKNIIWKMPSYIQEGLEWLQIQKQQ